MITYYKITIKLFYIINVLSILPSYYCTIFHLIYYVVKKY